MTTEVQCQQPMLIQLESDGGELAQGFRTRESANVKSKLGSLRRQWEDLCTKSEEESSNLSSHVTHWNQYQSDIEQLIPWLDSAEAQLKQPAGQATNLDDAKQQHANHKVRSHTSSFVSIKAYSRMYIDII